MIGKDLKLWMIKQYNNINRWVVSDFYKEYKKAEKKLIKLLSKSIVKFTYKSYEDTIIKYEDEDTIDLPENNIIIHNSDTFFLASHEFTRLCCISGYYKYVISTGDDVMIKNKKIKEVSYFYQLNDKAKIWKGVDKMCSVYKKEAHTFINKNKDLINKLDKNKQAYIYKFF
jgi:hypothetical protein